MHPLLAKARAGLTVTLIDKIEAETSADELAAMLAAVLARGQDLSADEAQAFARRRAELARASR